MVKWQVLVLALIFSAPSWSSVKSYFNQNEFNSYTDPYRNIRRQGDDLERVIIDQILKARRSIYVAVQELRLPKIAAALIEKQRQGVDVRLVLEHDYNFNVLSQRDSSENNEYEASRVTELRAFIDVNRNGKFEKSELETRDAIYMLQQSDVKIMDDTSDNSRGSGLMHHKFIVIDGKTTLISSANFTMSCIHGDILTKGSLGNANSMVVVNSVLLARIFTEEFLQLWGNGRRGNFGQNKTYRGPQTVTVRGVKISVQFSPTSRRYNWEESVNGFIGRHLSKARQSVKGALFVFSDQKIANVLQGVHSRGADLGFLIEPKFAFREYSELLDMFGLAMLNNKCEYEPDNNPWLKPLKEGGIGISPRGDMLHHKFAVVDRKTVIVGSQNWSDAANYVNDETLIVIEDAGISDRYTQEYKRIKRNSQLGPGKRLRDEIRSREKACREHGYYQSYEHKVPFSLFP